MTTKAHRLLFALPRPPRCFTIHSPLRCFLSPVSNPGAPRGSERGERRLIGRTDTLSISLEALTNVPGGNNAPAGMRCDKLALDGPEGSGSRPGALICGIGRGLICRGGRSSPEPATSDLYTVSLIYFLGIKYNSGSSVFFFFYAPTCEVIELRKFWNKNVSMPTVFHMWYINGIANVMHHFLFLND